MKKYINPNKSDWAKILERPVFETKNLVQVVQPILNKVKKEGDKAVFEYTAKFDKVKLNQLRVTTSEIEMAKGLISEELKIAIRTAKANIQKFHEAQREPSRVVETMPGVTCWRKSLPIDKIGLYIPGGTAPLFSTVLMLGVPATVAGCNEIVLCTPPDKSGMIHPAILYTADLLGINQIFKVGGAQAIAAMAFGTETIPSVYKIFGPGNQYVTIAKQLVSQNGIAIDMPAGPSEVAIVADDSANPQFIAADLLSQAEHGIDSQVLFVTTSAQIQKAVEVAIREQVKTLPRKTIALKALENSRSILIDKEADMVRLINEYAPEHLILAVKNDEKLALKITNAGSVFLGHYTPESVGDYASGTNHTLPTNGFAKSYSGVSLDSFIKKITFQKLTKEGLQNIGKTVEIMAAAESLEAHKRAVSVRM